MFSTMSGTNLPTVLTAVSSNPIYHDTSLLGTGKKETIPSPFTSENKFKIDPHVEKRIEPLITKIRNLALRRGDGAFRDVGIILGINRKRMNLGNRKISDNFYNFYASGATGGIGDTFGGGIGRTASSTMDYSGSLGGRGIESKGIGGTKKKAGKDGDHNTITGGTEGNASSGTGGYNILDIAFKTSGMDTTYGLAYNKVSGENENLSDLNKKDSACTYFSSAKARVRSRNINHMTSSFMGSLSYNNAVSRQKVEKRQAELQERQRRQEEEDRAESEKFYTSKTANGADNSSSGRSGYGVDDKIVKNKVSKYSSVTVINGKEVDNGLFCTDNSLLPPVRVSIEEFKIKIAEFGILLTTAECNLLLSAFKDSVGYLVVSNFFEHLRSTISPPQLMVVAEVFAYLSTAPSSFSPSSPSSPSSSSSSFGSGWYTSTGKTKKGGGAASLPPPGFIFVKDLFSQYDPSLHPLVQQGEASPEEVMRMFCDVFEGEDKAPNGLVSWDEYRSYYSAIAYRFRKTYYPNTVPAVGGSVGIEREGGVDTVEYYCYNDYREYPIGRKSGAKSKGITTTNSTANTTTGSGTGLEAERDDLKGLEGSSGVVCPTVNNDEVDYNYEMMIRNLWGMHPRPPVPPVPRCFIPAANTVEGKLAQHQNAFEVESSSDLAPTRLLRYNSPQALLSADLHTARHPLSSGKFKCTLAKPNPERGNKERGGSVKSKGGIIPPETVGMLPNIVDSSGSLLGAAITSYAPQPLVPPPSRVVGFSAHIPVASVVETLAKPFHKISAEAPQLAIAGSNWVPRVRDPSIQPMFLRVGNKANKHNFKFG